MIHPFTTVALLLTMCYASVTVITDTYDRKCRKFSERKWGGESLPQSLNKEKQLHYNYKLKNKGMGFEQSGNFMFGNVCLWVWHLC
jgi:hypothetical protein